jgi:VPDSG-CTERM motif
MKMNFKVGLAMVAGAFVAMWATQVEATPISLTVGDLNYLGSIVPDHPADATDEAGYIDYLISLNINVSGSDSGQTITRSGNSFSPLDTIPTSPSPVPAFSSTGNNTSISLTSAQEYVAVRYGASSGGIAYVWYIGGLDYTLGFTVPANSPAGNGISGINVFEPYTPSVPDGGTTALLLGAALSGLGLLRRKLS